MALDKSAKCLTCGYCLWGLPTQISPECGRAFNPADASSYQGGTFVPNWRRWAVPPATWEVATALVGAVYLVLMRSSASGALEGVPLGLGCAIVPLMFFLTVLWTVRARAAVADRARAEHDVGGRTRKIWRWLTLPICLLTAGSTFACNWPLRARFAASRSAFEAEARALLARPPAANAEYLAFDRYVGAAYRVSHAVVDGQRKWVVFMVDFVPIDDVGFAFSPAVPMGEDVGLPRGWYVYED